MSKYVRGHGPKTAKLMILGEFPYQDDEESGMYFSGTAGDVMEKLTRAAGFNLEDTYRTAVVKVRPPHNDLKLLPSIGFRPEDFYEELEKEILEIRPFTILALDNEALKSTTEVSGISKWRGSILRSKWPGIKVVPSFPPNSLLHTPGGTKVDYSMKPIMILDYKRALEESWSSEYSVPDRNLMVCKNAYQLYKFLEKNEQNNVASVDIESHNGITICIGIAFNRHEALSIPLLSPIGWKEPLSEHELNEIWMMLIKWFEKPGLKLVGANFKYDQWKLWTVCGFPVPNPYADTMLMHHTWMPELPQSLAFATSIHTREPYYKDEGKEYNPKKDKIDRMFLYNAKDCAVTFEVYEVLSKELEDIQLLEFFYDFVMQLHPLYVHIEGNGFKVDEGKRKELQEKYRAKLLEAEQEFEKISSFKPVTAVELKKITKDCKRSGEEIPNCINLGSPIQLAKLLYETLGFPNRKSTDEDTLVALQANHASKDEKKRRILELILDIRKYQKTLGTYLSVKADYDGRMRTSYRITGTETGRTSTSRLEPPVRPDKLGIAFQTMTKHGDIGPEVREMYVPGY
jgi:uracil-DNA glycosylase family 4